MLPGKLFEYLAAARPVLGIGQTDGAMAMILEETKAGTVADWDDYRSIAEFIDSCWQHFKKDDTYIPSEDISRFSRKALTARMASLMDELTKQEANEK